ncbi:hypothetical protein D3C80_955760 [compost metagenome]
MRTWLFGAVKHGNRTHAFWQNGQQMLRRERAIQTHFQHTDFFAARKQFIDHLFTRPDRGAHQDNDALCLRMAVIFKGFIFSSRRGREIIHRLLDMVVHRVIPGICRLARLEIGIRVR